MPILSLSLHAVFDSSVVLLCLDKKHRRKESKVCIVHNYYCTAIADLDSSFYLC